MSSKQSTRRFFTFVLLVIILCAQLAPFSVWAETPAETQAQLENELADVEKQIADLQNQLAVTATQKKTLANKISQLQLKQKELNALIHSTTLKVNKLSTNISTIEINITSNIKRQEKLRMQIAILLRLMNEDYPGFIVTLASAHGLSEVLTELQNYSKLSAEVGDLVDKLKTTKSELANQKGDLEDQKSSAVNLLQIKSIQNQELKNTLTEQSSLLAETKGIEANFAAALADKKKRAAEIRNRIYELFNTGSQVNFGQALEIAKMAGQLTGIRPAYILAVLTQESNLGKNVGTCNRPGDPPEKSWKVVMKPDRDQDPFIQITSELGLDPDKTPVSCPMHDKKGKQVGWGGAMGPAQFIPSTWMGYRSKVTALTGKATANPWDIRDAFLAASVKLRAGGADGTADGEWRAAMIYFAGSVKTQFRFYGDNVLALAKKYQQDIDDLNGS